MFLPRTKKIDKWLQEITLVDEVTPKSDFASWFILNTLFKNKIHQLFEEPIKGIRFYQSSFEVPGCKRKYISKHYGFFAFIQLEDGRQLIVWQYSYTSSAVDLHSFELLKWSTTENPEKNNYMELMTHTIRKFQSIKTTNTYLGRYCYHVKKLWVRRLWKALRKSSPPRSDIGLIIERR